MALLALAMETLHFSHSLTVVFQLLLQLRNRMRTLLVLLFEHGFDARQLLAISVRCQFKVLVNVIIAGCLLFANRFLGAGHFRVDAIEGLKTVGAMMCAIGGGGIVVVWPTTAAAIRVVGGELLVAEFIVS